LLAGTFLKPKSSLGSLAKPHRSGYRYLSKVALADIAFVARSDTLPGLFEASARALTGVMVDRRTLVGKTARTVELTSPSRDRLLYDFLSDLIVTKDVDSLLFKDFRVSIKEGKSMRLTCLMKGEEIDRERHRLRNDVKAVTMHMFGIKKTAGRWAATVVLDI
jgi:SHS2 domain-containing protein